jgi:hypothetical protein
VRKGEFIPGGLCGQYRGNVPKRMGGVCTVAIRSAPGERPLYLQGGEFCAASYGRDPAHPHYAASFPKGGKLRPDYNSRIVEDEHCPFGSIFQIQIEVTRDLMGTPAAPVEVIVDQQLPKVKTKRKGTPAHSSVLQPKISHNLRTKKRKRNDGKGSEGSDGEVSGSSDGGESYVPEVASDDGEGDDDAPDKADEDDVRDDAAEIGAGDVGDDDAGEDEGFGNGGDEDEGDEDV